MNKTKRTKLETYGWQVVETTDFLALSPEEG